MTSAPRSPRRAPHQGPAMTRERSSTRTPSSARGKVAMPVTIPRLVLHSSGSELRGRPRRVTIESKSVALGIGVSWGDGKLDYEGKTRDFSLRGLSVVDIGVSKVSARGKVFNLKKVEDFSGTYAGAQAGVKLTLAGEGIEVKLK